MRDYVAWHEAYDDPTSSLSKRLGVVRERFRLALDALGPGSRSVLSLCAGEGRDVVPVLAAHPRRRDIRAVLVEVHHTLAARAASAARESGLDGVEVRCLDAGQTQGYAEFVPVDVLLLCGVLGNISEDDAASMVTYVPAMVRSGGFVLWTRGGSDPDARPMIRRWFIEAGMSEVAFDGDPESYGVGLNVVDRLSDATLPERLFTVVR